MDDQTPTQDPQSSTPAADQNGDNTAFTALQAELEATKTRLTELTQISQQALADLQNFKKRTEDEKLKFVAYANAALISDLLPVLDNINRAITHIPEDPAAKEWASGILAVMKQLDDVLKLRGLENVETTDQQFDPSLHEAVMTEEGPQDKIIREVEKGYKIADRILRRAKVTVGKSASPAAPSSTPTPSTETSATPDTDGNLPETDDDIYA